MPSTMKDALTKAFEPDFTLELRTLSSGNSLFLEDKIMDLLEDINYDYAASTTEGILLVKQPKEKQHGKGKKSA